MVVIARIGLRMRKKSWGRSLSAPANLQVASQQAQRSGRPLAQDKNRSCLPLVDLQRSLPPNPPHPAEGLRNLGRTQAVMDYEVQNGVVPPIAGLRRQIDASRRRTVVESSARGGNSSPIDPRRIDDVQAAGRFATVPTITQERPQLRDNVLERLARLFSRLLVWTKNLDVHSIQPRQAALRTTNPRDRKSATVVPCCFERLQ